MLFSSMDDLSGGHGASKRSILEGHDDLLGAADTDANKNKRARVQYNSFDNTAFGAAGGSGLAGEFNPTSFQLRNNSQDVGLPPLQQQQQAAPSSLLYGSLDSRGALGLPRGPESQSLDLGLGSSSQLFPDPNNNLHSLTTAHGQTQPSGGNSSFDRLINQFIATSATTSDRILPSDQNLLRRTNQAQQQLQLQQQLQIEQHIQQQLDHQLQQQQHQQLQQQQQQHLLQMMQLSSRSDMPPLSQTMLALGQQPTFQQGPSSFETLATQQQINSMLHQNPQSFLGGTSPSIPAAALPNQAALAPPPAPTGPPQYAVCLQLASDRDSLSSYQNLLRQQIEFFEAGPDDVKSSVQGRNKRIVLGQVGIRCRHCAHLKPKQRPKGAMYYPTTLEGVYQTAQNLARGHLAESCNNVSQQVRQSLMMLREAKSLVGGGKKYWADGARALGVKEKDGVLQFDHGGASGGNSGVDGQLPPV